MITSFTRGHQIIYKNNEWLYVDNLQPIKNYERPCKRCEQYPDKNGYDKCLGKLKNIKFACCGHGVQDPFTIKK